MTSIPPLRRAARGARPRRALRASARPLALTLVLALAALSIGPTRADAASPRLVLSSPVSPVTVTRVASLPAQPWNAGHRGIDLDADVGDPVTAPAAGVVSFAGFVVNRPVISMRHGGGLVTSLEPVDSGLSAGDVVARGQTIGTVTAHTGHCAPRTCVHWGLRRDGVYVDPLDYLEGFGRIQLLSQGTG